MPCWPGYLANGFFSLLGLLSLGVSGSLLVVRVEELDCCLCLKLCSKRWPP